MTTLNRRRDHWRIGATGNIPPAPTSSDVGEWITWWTTWHPGASTDYVDLIRRDVNGVLFLWDTKLEGEPPANAPIDRRLSDSGGRIPALNTLPGFQLPPASGPVDSSPLPAPTALPPPTPAPSPFTIRPVRQSPLATQIRDELARGILKVNPGAQATSSTNPNGTASTVPSGTSLLTLAALTLPAWGTLLWLKYGKRFVR